MENQTKQSAIVIAIAQSKGGTAKTTSVINLAGYFAIKGLRVLAIDTDPQSNLAFGLGIDPMAQKFTMFDLLTSPKVQARDVIVKSQHNIDLIPSMLDLEGLTGSTLGVPGFEKALAKKLVGIKPDYDIILIDTPPSLMAGTINAMVAADHLLIPVTPEPFSLVGLGQVYEKFKVIKEDSNPKLEILGVFFTKVEVRTVAHKTYMQQVKADWGDLVFDQVISHKVKVWSSQAVGQPLTMSDPNSDVALEYAQIAKEILEHANK